MADPDFLSLDAVLSSQGASRQQLAAKRLYQDIQALSAMHSTGTVHGDVRCENILVAPDLQSVKLGGLLHSFDWNALQFRVTASDMNLCVAGGLPSPASDIYAVGMTVFEALTGLVPANDKDDASVLALKKAKDTQLPAHYVERIDREAWSLIQDACHHNPIFRPNAQIAMMTLRSIQSKAPTTVQAHAVIGHPFVLATPSLVLHPQAAYTSPQSVTIQMANALTAQAATAMPTYQYPLTTATHDAATAFTNLDTDVNELRSRDNGTTPSPSPEVPIVLPSRTPSSSSPVATLIDAVGSWGITALAVAQAA